MLVKLLQNLACEFRFIEFKCVFKHGLKDHAPRKLTKWLGVVAIHRYQVVAFGARHVEIAADLAHFCIAFSTSGDGFPQCAETHHFWIAPWLGLRE